MEEGYYKTYTQEWFEDSDSKTGWTGLDWNEEKDFEMVKYLSEDKFGNPTKALFKYVGPVYIGEGHCAYNVQAAILWEFMEIIKKYPDKIPKEIAEIEPRITKLLNSVNIIEEKFSVKEYLKGN